MPLYRVLVHGPGNLDEHASTGQPTDPNNHTMTLLRAMQHAQTANGEAVNPSSGDIFDS